MIRVVLIAVLSVALLAVVIPAVEEGSEERTAARLDADVERLERATTALSEREDPTRRGIVGATRLVTVRVPAPSWSDATVDYVSVGGRPGSLGDRRRVVYRLEGGNSRTVRLSGVPIRTPNGPVVLRGTGKHRLRLSLVSENGVPVVAVTRSGG